MLLQLHNSKKNIPKVVVTDGFDEFHVLGEQMKGISVAPCKFNH